MTNGTIKKVVADRGFGFITAEDGKEYFFHRGGLQAPARLRPPHRRREGRVRGRAEPQGPARDPGQRGLTGRRPIIDGGRRSRAPAAPSGGRSRRQPGIGCRHAHRPKRSPAISDYRVRFDVPAASLRHRHVHPDLAASVGDHQVVALHPPVRARPYPPRSVTASVATCRADYLGRRRSLERGRRRRRLDPARVRDLGRPRRRVRPRLRAGAATPVVTTLHTVLRRPTPAPAGDPRRARRRCRRRRS